MRIELLHVEDCPGHAELRERLPRLLATAGVDAEVVERLVDSERQAQVARFVGSPTVRVDGRDVDPDEGVGASGYGLRCRLYATAAGPRRSPPDELILAALAAGSGAGPAGRHNTEGSSTPMASVRHASADDVEAVLELWRAAGAAPTVTDAVEPLRALLRRDPAALLVAEADAEVVGSLIAAWNGWRGSFYRLAVHPAHRRRGLATALLRRGEEQLRELGAVRLDAIVDDDEEAAVGFWRAAGYTLQGDRRRFVRNLG